MSEVLELLSSELDQHRIREIASHLGTEESQTEAAIAAALPTLVSAMGRHADSEHGANQLTSHMQGIGGGTLGDLLGSILGSATKRPPAQAANPSPRPPMTSGQGLPRGRDTSFDDILPPGMDGANQQMPAPTSGLSSKSIDDMLGSVLGGKQKRVEESIGRSSGLDLKKVGPLIAILGPLVIGAMKMRARAKSPTNASGINPADLTNMMRGERSSIEQRAGGSMIGRMLDQDGDGDFDLSDIMKLGMKFLFSRR
jgi:hypothetical protein